MRNKWTPTLRRNELMDAVSRTKFSKMYGGNAMQCCRLGRDGVEVTSPDVEAWVDPWIRFWRSWKSLRFSRLFVTWFFFLRGRLCITVYMQWIAKTKVQWPGSMKWNTNVWGRLFWIFQVYELHPQLVDPVCKCMDCTRNWLTWWLRNPEEPSLKTLVLHFTLLSHMKNVKESGHWDTEIRKYLRYV